MLWEHSTCSTGSRQALQLANHLHSALRVEPTAKAGFIACTWCGCAILDHKGSQQAEPHFFLFWIALVNNIPFKVNRWLYKGCKRGEFLGAKSVASRFLKLVMRGGLWTLLLEIIQTASTNQPITKQRAWVCLHTTTVFTGKSCNKSWIKILFTYFFINLSIFLCLKWQHLMHLEELLQILRWKIPTFYLFMQYFYNFLQFF